ncbi:MAG: hypothetical protein MJH10_14525 [Epibacterium sp.]|nr:hypothetical protein [Epibacterium sp.]NQX74742.1 hypothetical protein [Epibacterium sp.]
MTIQLKTNTIADFLKSEILSNKVVSQTIQETGFVPQKQITEINLRKVKFGRDGSLIDRISIDVKPPALIATVFLRDSDTPALKFNIVSE